MAKYELQPITLEEANEFKDKPKQLVKAKSSP
jgi:hypothetical protein